MRSSVAATLAFAVVATLGVAAPAAAETTCTGTIGAQSIDDDVVVPAGASCRLEGTRIDGNVVVGSDARLIAIDATIGGNVQDANDDAGPVTLTGGSVGGSVQLEQGASATVTGTRIDADLQFESNAGALEAVGNDIGGNLQANQNTGGLTIRDNVIDGNLQCQANVPAPTGSGNVVQGSAEDQCRELTGTPTPEPTRRFADVPAGSLHADAIEALVASEITAGCSADGTLYCPERAVTRAQMATFLDQALSLPAGPLGGFTDVPSGSTHEVGIAAVLQAGITTGCSDTPSLYCPERAVTRGQMATFLDEALSLPAGPLGGFTDVPSGSTHEVGIAAVRQAGITLGCSSGGTAFCPEEPVTRAQMATFLDKALAIG